jgi:solute carrier family 25 citrate transporter 1
MAAAQKGKEKEKPIASLLAGATAGGIESFVTFPLESLKTQLQFGSLNGGKVGVMRAACCRESVQRREGLGI